MAAALKKKYLITSNNVTADDVGGWVDGEIFAAALKACGKPSVCTRAKFRTSLQGIKNLSFGGLMSPVSFSATNHYAPTKTEFFAVGTGGRPYGVGHTKLLTPPRVSKYYVII